MLASIKVHWIIRGMAHIKMIKTIRILKVDARRDFKLKTCDKMIVLNLEMASFINRAKNSIIRC